jgi:hypothetical protein
MAADKAQCRAMGMAFMDAIWAVKDGLQLTQDSPAFFALLTAITSAADDIQADADAAVAYALSGATESFGDKKAG